MNVYELWYSCFYPSCLSSACPHHSSPFIFVQGRSVLCDWPDGQDMSSLCALLELQLYEVSVMYFGFLELKCVAK